MALKKGDVEITIMDTTGKHGNATLKNALYIPAYPQNIFSVQAATERGATVTFICRLYYLSTFDKNDSDSVNYTCDLQPVEDVRCEFKNRIQYLTPCQIAVRTHPSL